MDSKLRKILILGSGMMVEPLIDYILIQPINSITLASNMIDVAKEICDRKQRCTPEEVNVTENNEKLRSLINSHNLVISFIPAFLHIHVAKLCIDEKKNLLTASYISPEMKELDKVVKENGLIFMNEIGLDPGIDHIITHKVIDDCKEKDSKIIEYESWCGALPSPDCTDNPLLYKFSWSPKGALTALKNNVVFIKDGLVKEIKEPEVLLSTVEKKFNACLNFEGYYNRDSLKYKDVYGLNEIKTLIRGTIRYKGFSFVTQCFKNLNLFSTELKVENDCSWRELLENILKNNSTRISDFLSKSNLKFTHNDLSESELTFYKNLALLSISYIRDEYFSDKNLTELFKNVVTMFIFLDVYNEKHKLTKDSIYLDCFANLLEKKLKMESWEKDMVFMQNSFVVESKSGSKSKINYDLLLFGHHNNLPYSATALTVAYPAAIVAQLILDGKIEERGVLMPSSKVICDSVFEELKKMKINIRQSVEYID